MRQNLPILVTGAAGLIGTSLVQQLVRCGDKIIAIDKHFPISHPGNGDIQNTQFLEEAINKCRGVVHLAAVSRVVWGEQDPQTCWDINVEATACLLKIIDKSITRPWIIYASSREVYGQQDHLPLNEEAELIPLNVYARSKIAAEKLIKQYRDRGLITAILRFSSVYGSINDHVDRVIPAFCRNAILGQLLRVEGMHNLFDFTHVKDTVTGILAMISQLEGGINNLPPIHLTSGKGTSLIEVIQLIEQVLKKSIPFEEAPARTYDVHRFYGDPSRAQKLLDWCPRIDFFQGISQMLKEYQSHFAKGI